MAGGTGGHVFPGLAVAEQMKLAGWEVSWLGTADRMEATLVPEYGFKIDFVDIAGVRGNGIKRLVFAPFRIFKSILQSRRIIKRDKIDLVLGMGGFASGPGGIAAWTLGIPLILHEQNAAAGITNRLLSYFSVSILMGFPGAFTGPKATLVGNPIRKELIELPQKSISPASHPLKILVIGGSLGAQILNEVLPKVFKQLPNQSIDVVHQTGKGHLSNVKLAYDKALFDYKLYEFITNIDEHYNWADLIICRAGALTVAEVSVVGLPAIFVPLPHAVDDHQTKNAQSLVNEGASILIPQKQLSVKTVVHHLEDLIANRPLLEKMSKKSKQLGIVDATSSVSAMCEKQYCKKR